MATMLAGLVAVATPSTAGTINEPYAKAPRHIVSGWLPYWTTDSSLATVSANADLFYDVVGFWHSATGTSTIVDQLSDSRRAAAVAALHADGVRVLGGVTDGTSARKMASILANKTSRTTHIKALVALALANDYDGIDLDYEKFAFSDGSSTWATTRPAWVAFVKELSAALHAKGLWLTAAVPVMYDSDRDGSSGYWVYDYASIGGYVDRLRIMTYDYSVSAPGPIAPIAWVRRVLDYATSVVPASKIQVGAPAYGRDWPTTTKGCPVDNMPGRATYTSAGAAALAADKGVTPTWNSTYAEKTFSYNKKYSGENSTGDPVSCTIKRTVWFDDESAMVARAKLVGEYKLAGIAQWAVGGEDKGQWSRLRTYALEIRRASSRLELFAGDTTYGSAIRVHGTLKTSTGTAVSGEDWTLYWRDRGATTWTAVNRGTTSAQGTMSVTKKPTRTGYWKLSVGGSWTRFPATTQQNRTLVKIKVAAAFSKPTVKRGTTVTLKGSVDPNAGGLLVERQRYVGGEWVTVGSTTTRTDGTFSMSVVPVERATYTYRVKVSGSKYRSNGYSPTIRITVS